VENRVEKVENLSKGEQRGADKEKIGLKAGKRGAKGSKTKFYNKLLYAGGTNFGQIFLSVADSNNKKTTPDQPDQTNTIPDIQHHPTPSIHLIIINQL
jgi:hypothetical protein